MVPDVDLIDIKDIAHALSLQCRYAGHVREFYSVAEHSVRVSMACARGDALWGLLHDASEAYILDIPKPLKDFLGTIYKDAETVLMSFIATRFGLRGSVPASVHRADKLVLNTEARDLLPPLFNDPHWIDKSNVQSYTIRPLGPAAAERWFLERYRELTKVKAAA